MTPPPAPATVSAPADVTVAVSVGVGTRDLVAEQGAPGSPRSVSAFLVDAVLGGQGSLEIRRDEQVLFLASLVQLDAYVFRPAEPVLLAPGRRTWSRTGECHVDVTFSALVAPR